MIYQTHPLFEEDHRIAMLGVMGRIDSPISIAEMRDQMVSLGNPEASFSTVARRLKDLADLGLCHQVGREGRVLSAEGQAYYLSLQEKDLRQQLLDQARGISTSEGLEQLLRIRRAVEPEAVFEFAQNASEEDILDLQHLEDEYKKVVSVGGSHPRGSALDFHRMIARHSKNPFVQLVLNEALHPKLDRVEVAMDAVLRQQHVHESSLGFHDAILEALLLRDALAAEILMREHLDSMLSEFEKKGPRNNIQLLDSILEWSMESGT